MTTRRIFLRNSALAMVGVGVLPSWLTRTAWAAEAARRGKILVVIFQRGAADGLNIVVPHGEAAYYRYRPTIAIPRPRGKAARADAALDLDGFFGLHPALSGLKPLWDGGHLALVHAAGSPDPSRSHFQAQDYMEAGTPGQPDTSTGWLNRVLRAQCPDCESGQSHSQSPLRAVAMDAQMPLTLRGPAPAVPIRDLAACRVGYGPLGAIGAESLQSLYEHEGGALFQPAGRDTFAALKLLRHLNPHQYQPANGANYPRRGLGHGLRQIAQLIKARVGVEVAFADIGGWDNHVAEGSTKGQLAGRLREFGDALAAFWTDLGDRAEDVLVVTMSEFGRTAHENGSAGTDHGHANVMFILGGPVRGGKVYGRWPGLEAEQLYQGRDLALTTDFRLVLAEAVRNHLGVADLGPVFPGFKANPRQFRGFLRT